MNQSSLKSMGKSKESCCCCRFTVAVTVVTLWVGFSSAVVLSLLLLRPFLLFLLLSLSPSPSLPSSSPPSFEISSSASRHAHFKHTELTYVSHVVLLLLFSHFLNANSIPCV